MEMEDYGHPFTCHAGMSAAYFMLKPPGNIPHGLQTVQSAQNHGKETHMRSSGIKCLVWGNKVILNIETGCEI